MTECRVFEQAVEACERALVDYQAGLLDEHELRRELGRAGVVVSEAGTWILDLGQGRWRPLSPVPPDGPFDGTTLRRWRAGLRTLLDDAPEPDRDARSGVNPPRPAPSG